MYLSTHILQKYPRKRLFSFGSFIFIFTDVKTFYYIYCLLHLYVDTCHTMCGVHRAISRSWFSPSTCENIGMKLRPWGMAACNFTFNITHQPHILKNRFLISWIFKTRWHTTDILMFEMRPSP